MSSTAMVIAVGAFLIVILLVAALVARRRRAQHIEERRYQARDHRDLAAVAQLDADRRSAEADERSARARREELAAAQQRLEAERANSDAEELRIRADELDPDVKDVASDDAPTLDGTTAVDDIDGSDLSVDTSHRQ